MVVNPDEKRYGQAELTLEALGSTRTITATFPGGTTYPDANVETPSSQIFTLTSTTTGPTPPIGTWQLALVPDNEDTSGDYSLYPIGPTWAGNFTPSTVQINNIPNEFGMWRLVILVGDSATTALNINTVDTSGTSAEYHHDSDGNSAQGGLNVNQPDTLVDGYTFYTLRPNKGGSHPFPVSNQKYDDSFAVAVRLTSSFTGRGTLSPNNTTRFVKLDFTPGSSSGFIRSNTWDTTTADEVTLNATFGPIDSTWPEASTAHTLQIGIGSEFGDTIPDDEKAEFLVSGTITGTTEAQRAWLQFKNVLTGWEKDSETLATYNQLGSTTLTAGSGIYLYEDAAITTRGVLSFDDSGRTQASRYFNRRYSASVVGNHARPYFRAYVGDAFGQPLASKNVSLAVLDSDGTQENTQNLTTSASGLIEWDWTIGSTVKAFNAFKKTSPDNPDSLGTHDVLIPRADAYIPAGSKTNQYPDPITQTQTRDFNATAQPARAKDIRLTGNDIGSNEPTSTETDVFGVHAEIIFEGMWSGNSGDNTISDPEGQPNGPLTRSKTTAGGSYFFKTSSLIDENTFGLANASAHNPTDRMGRPYITTSANFLGAEAAYNRTANSIHKSAVALDNKHNLETSLGYSHETNDSETFGSVAPTTDAATVAYWQGFSPNSTQRSSFSLTAGESIGFTSDTYIYGYRCQIVEYSIVRDDLAIVLIADPANPAPGNPIRFVAAGKQILPDNQTLDKEFDSTPILVIEEDNGTGVAPTELAALTMTPIGGSPSAFYEAEFTPPTPTSNDPQTFAVTAFGKVGGSRPAPGRSLFTIGGPAARDPAIQPAAIVTSNGTTEGKFKPGDEFVVFFSQLNTDTQTLIEADDIGNGPEVFFSIITGVRYLHTDGNFYLLSQIGQPGQPTEVAQFRMTEAFPGGYVYSFDGITNPSTASWDDNTDLVVTARIIHNGVSYSTTDTTDIARPDVTLSIAAGDTGNPLTHFVHGQTLTVGAVLENSDEKLDYDTSSAKIAIRRFNASSGEIEHLNASNQWVTGDVFYYHDMTQSGVDPKLALYTADTSTWPASGGEDILIRVKMTTTDGGRFADDFCIHVVGSANNHAGYSFDALDFAAGLPFR